MDQAPGPDERVAAVAALDQPLRRALYRLLARAGGGWTSRDEAAEALGVPRTVAAFHLDKLADAGVVDVRFERTTGRTGPGAGRPAKLYRPSADEVAASVPDRRYDLAGALLAEAVATASATGAPVADCLHTAARTAGLRLGAAAGAEVRAAADRRAALVDVLARHGYEPQVAGRGRETEVALANCPFHRLAADHRDLVCGMNLDFLGGVVEGLGAADGLAARLAPEPDWCCVRIAAA